MSTVKLLQKHKGSKVVLVDGTRTTISSVLATTFKLANGDKLKPDQLMATATGFKQKKEAASKASAKTSKAAPAKKAPAKSSGDDISKLPRKECVTRLVAEEKLRVRTDARGKSVEELRDMLRSGGKKSTKTKVVEKEVPAKKKKAGKTSSKPTLEEVRDRIKKTISGKSSTSSVSKKKKKDKEPLDLKPVIKITPQLAKSVEQIVQEKVGRFIHKTTGYDFTIATVGGIHNDTCMTLQIGLMYTAATDDEKQEYVDSIHEDAEATLEDDDDLGSLNELDDSLDEEDDELDSEEVEEEEEEDELDEELDDESEEEEDGDEEESEDDETEGEEEEFEEEEEGSELDEAELLSAAVEASGLPVKTLKPLVASWVENYEQIEDALGDEVTIGTGLISNKTGDTLVVIGYNSDKDKIALYNTVSDKTTAAGITEVAKMEFAEFEEDETEEEADEEDQL